MSKYLYITLLFALLVLGWYGFPIIRNRYFEGDTENKELAAPSEIIPTNKKPDNRENPTSSDFLDLEDQTDTNQATMAGDGEVLEDITRADCDSECTRFSGTILEYCQETCGLKSIEMPKSECAELSGLKRDYCLKDLGITRKDYSWCEKIQDANIRTTCQNRILEDAVDESISNTLE